MSQMTQKYNKPGPCGRQLIRKVIGRLKSSHLKLPLSSLILIGVSSGIDSVASAHLLIHFGRRIVHRSEVTLLHVHHGWRGSESDQDAIWVQNLGVRWGVPVVI